MNNTTRMIAAAGAAAVMLTVPASALAAPHPADAPAEAVRKGDEAARSATAVFLAESATTSTVLDLGEEGFGPGDTIVEHGTLADPDTGDEVGDVVTRIQIIQVYDDEGADFEFHLDCTVKLADGNLYFGGAGRSTDVGGDGATFTLTGGTAAYSGSSGSTTVAATEIDGESGNLITFDFAG